MKNAFTTQPPFFTTQLRKTTVQHIVKNVVFFVYTFVGDFNLNQHLVCSLIIPKNSSYYCFCAALGQGLLISTLADSQQVAFQLATLVSMLPTMILSGFMFPIRSMPLFLQILSNITPAKFYLVIMRGIVLKGVGVEAFWDQIVYLGIFITVVVAISIKRFKNHAI